MEYAHQEIRGDSNEVVGAIAMRQLKVGLHSERMCKSGVVCVVPVEKEREKRKDDKQSRLGSSIPICRDC